VPPIDPAPTKIILLDIEGTTTPVEFVYETLFPYARTSLKEFLKRNWSDPEVREAVSGLRSHRDSEIRAGELPPPWIVGTDESETASAAEYGWWLMDRDSKTGPLKVLQGLIWQSGYQQGRLKGQVYTDVPAAFERWSRQGKVVAIYSSGSELAQRLLFATTESGDLTRHIRTFFDTRVGMKANPESYRRIAELLRTPADYFLFLSDTLAELDAARSAGMKTALVVRGRSGDDPGAGHRVIHDFDAIG